MQDKIISKKDLNDRLFLYVLRIMTVVSIFNIAGNIIYGFPIAINIKWIVFIGVNACTYFYTKDQIVTKWKFFYFLVVVFLMLPISYIDSGGSNNNTIGYLFILIICVTFFFWGWRRYFLIASIVLIFNGLVIFENVYPELIKVYASQTQLLDRIVQITLLLVLSFLFLKAFSDAYAMDQKKLHRMAHFDSLTDLYNRRSFDEILIEEVSNKRKLFKFILFFDIDNFKKINDEKGHHYGDLMIQSTGQKLSKVFSDKGIVARWGGDEFAVLYQGNEKQVIDAVTRINRKNEVPLSCGIAKLTLDISADEVLKRADEALYKAKEAGKNQSKIYSLLQ